jgi:hypothetical protein
MTCSNEFGKVETHNSERVKDVGMHSSGNITGLTLMDFFSLPARARIALVFDGEYKAEGFLALKKL